MVSWIWSTSTDDSIPATSSAGSPHRNQTAPSSIAKSSDCSQFNDRFNNNLNGLKNKNCNSGTSLNTQNGSITGEYDQQFRGAARPSLVRFELSDRSSISPSSCSNFSDRRHFDGGPQEDHLKPANCTCPRKVREKQSIGTLISSRSEVELQELAQSINEGPDETDKFHKVTTREIVSEFFDRTTFHGLIDFYSAMFSWWLRMTYAFFSILWFMIISIAITFFVYEAYQTINNYLTTPVSTNVQLKSVSNLAFPDLTFCNFRKFNKSKLAAFGVSDDAARHLEHAVFDEYPYSFGMDIGLLNETAESDKELEDIAIANYGNESVDASRSYYHRLYEDLGFNCENFLRNCKQRTASFNCCAAATPELTSMGLCYTITNKFQRLPGFGNGIRIMIDSNSELYPPLSQTLLDRGIALIISEPTGIMESQNHGTVFVTSGTHSSVEIRATKLELQEDGSTCFGSEHVPETPFLYSSTTCEANCTITAILQNCSCVPLLPVGFVLPSHSFPYCTPNEIIHCARKAMSGKSDEIDKCNEACLPNCNRWNYAMTISETEFDVKTLALIGLDSSRRLRNNYVILDIYYNTLEYMLIQHVNTLTWDSMVGVVGGQLNLCAGVSIVTVIQLLFYIIRVILHRTRKTLQPTQSIAVKRKMKKSQAETASDRLKYIRRGSVPFANANT